MAEPEWTRIFMIKAKNLKKGDCWRLEFDDTITPNSPNLNWKQYIRNTSARFECTKCRRGWPSNKVTVIFHMHLMNGQGTVKVRRCCQDCKMCAEAPMAKPSISSENIDILLENLVKKIRIKCYYEDLGKNERPFVNLDVKSPHEPAHCEACRLGICTRN